MYELIVTEKPSTAKKISEALANGKALKKQTADKVAYYEVTHAGKDIVIASAVGHLFTVAKKKKSFAYPAFDIHWVPVHEVDKHAGHAQKYLRTLQKLSKEAGTVTVACDYDIEGEVIGLNIIRFICKKPDGHRMKFSTLTPEELRDSYANAHPTIDWGQAKAGETRHFLDWMYGINMSRALTLAVKAAGSFKLLSSGRVQGPALKIVADRELDIRSFVPVPYWELHVHALKADAVIEAHHKQGKFFDEPEAQAIYDKCRGHDAAVADVKVSRYRQKPPHPLDLGSLQAEAYRLFGLSPKATLGVAQDLYVGGYTSYPRTSSQQLPASLNFRELFGKLRKNAAYAELVSALLSAAKALSPHNGPKSDPAHPAIYPTGVQPTHLSERQAKVYDLIVKRFLATFAPDAVKESATVTLDVNGEPFVAQGAFTVEAGWHAYYAPYYRQPETHLPHVAAGEVLRPTTLTKDAKQTQPPKRFTPASLVAELEKRGLGTKATRADIIENLYARGYIKEKSIEATDLGLKTVEVLAQFIPEILDAQLTRHFEEEMEQIRTLQLEPGRVLGEAQEALTRILVRFKTQEAQVGEKLLAAHRDTQDEMNSIAPCHGCKEGTLMVRRGRYGRFLACSRYPDCQVRFRLPQSGRLKGVDQPCPACQHPQLIVIRPKRGPQTFCLDIHCPSKHLDANNEPKAPLQLDANAKCPTCGKPLVIRKSLYGQFIGCSGFPKCRYIERKKKEERVAAKEDAPADAV